MTSKNLSSPTAGCSTLVELLRQRAHQLADKTIYTFLIDGDKVSLTYGELDRQAQIIGARLQKLGVTGERALLLYPPGLEYIAAFFGCLYAGVISVPVYPPRLNRPMPRLQAIVADSRATVALTTSQILAGVAHRLDHVPDLAALCWLATDDLPGYWAEEWLDPAVNGATLAFLQYTSGSTAAPKGVMVSHGNLLHNQKMIQAAFGHTEHATVVGWLPVYHDMGLIGNILQPLYLGSHCILMSPLAFLQQPIRWLQAITEYKAHTSGGPNFAYDLCVDKIAPQQRAHLDLSCWKVAFNGAEPVRPGTLERFSRAFEPCGFRREAFYPCYGLAEATLIVSGGEKSAPPIVQTFQAAALEQDRVVHATKDEGSRALAGCGRTLLDQKIVITDPTSLTRCAPHHIGEIWVSGPSVAQGYWNHPGETRHTFQAYLKDSGEGPFLRSGDLGFLQDGELFVTGRLKDLIIIRGRNHYPQDIELTAEKSHPSLRPGCGAAFSVDLADEERVVIVHEVKRAQRNVDVEQVARAIRQAVVEEHEVPVYAVVLIKPGRIPKTSSGKIQRHACRARFLADDLNEIGSSIQEKSPVVAEQVWTLTSKDLLAVEPEKRQPVLEAYLLQQVATVAKIAPSQLSQEQPLSALGLDSLMAIELQHSLETGLNVVLPMTSFLEGTNIVQLAARILGKLAPSSARPTTIAPHQARVGEFPLSQGQRAIWFLHQLAPTSAVYNIATAVRIRTALDIPALQRAFQKLVDRHAALRTTFPPHRDEPVQMVHEQMQVSFHVQDASNWNEALLNDRLVKEAYTPFDLEQDSPLRVRLFTRSNREHILLLAVHHIVADFWSLFILVHELGKLYQTEKAGDSPSLTPLLLQYTDYVSWQTDTLASPIGERLGDYWREQLAGDLPALNLPTDHPRPPIQTYRGAGQTLKLSAELTQGLETLSRTHGVTLYMTVLAAFQTLLYRYTGQKDILVGSPTSGRSRAEFREVFGYFVNPVVLRANFSQDPSFITFLDQVRHTVLAALTHQDYPFILLTKQLQPKRDSAQSPIFQVEFVWQRDPSRGQASLVPLVLGESGVPLELGELVVESVVLPQRTIQFDLVLVVAELGDRLAVSFRYNADLFEATTIERMTDHFQTLLAGIVANPEQRVSELPILTEAENHQVLVEWNSTQADYAPTVCIHNLFEAQAEKAPDAVAVVFEDQFLTYAGLNHRANQLAHYLQTLGVGPDALVGIFVERSLEVIVGLLSVLKAGGAYVALDPVYPQERLGFILKNSQVLALLTQNRLWGNLPQYQMHTICLDTEWEKVSQQSKENPPIEVTGNNLVYVLYTSGSTGQPKGVAIEHRQLYNYVRGIIERIGAPPDASFATVSTIATDLGNTAIFPPLCSGGCVHVISWERVFDPDTLADYVSCHLVDCLKITASHLVALQNSVLFEQILPRQRLVIGGEASYWDDVERIQTLAPHLTILNHYGPTEATVGVLTYRVETLQPLQLSNTLPLGRPLPNTQIYLLDQQLNPVPVGVPGELFIAGDNLARGYLYYPNLTAERFVPNPFGNIPGDRLYKTGDLARYLPDGNIEFLGRSDQQVKIRGFRVEPKEVEAVLRQHPGVQEAIILAREDEPGNKRLVAYVIAGDEYRPANEMRRFLRERLPEYMLPAAFVTLEALPLLPNGKVDHRALPEPSDLRPQLETSYTAPRTRLEQTIATIWREGLNLDNVGVYDNFFDLGGDSIVSIQIASRMNQHGLKTRPHDILQYQTVAELAQVAVPINRQLEEIHTPVSGQVDLTPIQCWFFELELPNINSFSQTVTLYSEETINTQALTAALQKLLDHHDALRMRYVKRNSVWHQYNHAVGESVSLEIIDLSETSSSELTTLLEAEKKRIQVDLDITNGPIFKAGLFRIAEGHSILLLVCHHLVIDGVSWRIIISDLAEGYKQVLQGKPIKLASKTLSFLDWSKKLTGYAQTEELSKDFDDWKSIVQQGSFELPPDDNLLNNGSGTLDTITTRLSKEKTTALLREANRAYRTTINDLLMVALARVLHFLTGEKNIAISLEGHGRDGLGEDVDLFRTVGWFTTLFPIVLGIGQYSGLDQQIKLTKESLRRVPTKSLSFGLLKYHSPNKETRQTLNGYQLPSIVFNYLGQFGGIQREPFRVIEFSGKPLSDHQSAGRTIEINSIVFNDQLELDLSYSRNRYRAETIEQLARCLEKELETIISYCMHPGNCGFTPSDFSLLRTTQSELDELQTTRSNMPAREWEIEDIYPLSPMQQGMLFHALSAPSSLVSFEQFSFTLKGQLHQEYFQQAWSYTLAQSPVLRTVFDWQHFAQPVQIVLKENPSPVHWHDVSDLTNKARHKQLEEFKIADRERSFDLSKGPLVRINVFKFSEREFNCLLSHHHIVLDGWSFSLLLESVFQCYEALRQDNNKLPHIYGKPYKDYIAWLAQQNKEEAQAFWCQTLSDFATPTPLPADEDSSADQFKDAAEEELSLSDELTNQLKSFARRHRITLNTLIQAMWAILLRQYSHQQDVVFGVAVSGRPASIKNIERMLGLFVNNLPMRVQFENDKTIIEFLSDLQNLSAQMRNYEYSFLPDIQAYSSVPASKRLFDSLIVFQNYPLNEKKVLSPTSDLSVNSVTVKEMTNYDLVITVFTFNTDELKLRIQYKPDKFKKATVGRILNHCEILLLSITHNPNLRISKFQEIIGGQTALMALSDTPKEMALVKPVTYQPTTKMEKAVAEVCQRALELDEVDAQESFFNLGANSLAIAAIHARLQEMLKTEFPIVDMFKYPTIKALSDHLSQQKLDAPVLDRTSARVKRQKATIQRQGQLFREEMDIAIIGMTGRFPGAQSVDEFWQNLRSGVETISFFTDEEILSAGEAISRISTPNYVKAKPVLKDIEMFDAAFFGFSPREAEITDPQHRLFLECAWEAIENAGHNPETYVGAIGVFAGATMSTYLLFNLLTNSDARDTLGDWQLGIGNEKDSVPTRVSYLLNLKGPSVNVQSACSTSLVAIHLACQSLLTHQCDMALAGGVSIRLPQKAGYYFQKGVRSSDGHCRPFDAKADGMIIGNGVGVVVLKRLADAIADNDHIHAVIKGSAVNNDGALKVGYTAPSVQGQEAVITAAQTIAGVKAESISYVETHGTGTPMGDTIEITALTQAFRATTDKRGFCAIGSVKSNVGHLDNAAGVAGLIKAVLALEHKLIPPSLNFEEPNPEIDFDNSPFYVNTELVPWHSDAGSRYAGVSSFGIGGTNAHVILQEAPPRTPLDSARPWQLLVLSARTDSALETATDNLANYLEQHPSANLADVAYTLHRGRRAFDYRRTLVCRDLDDARTALKAREPTRVLTNSRANASGSPALVFMFPGLGVHYANMARGLYQTEPTFRKHVDQCAQLLMPHLGLDLRQVLYVGPGKDTAEPTSQTVDWKAMLRRAPGKQEDPSPALRQTSVAQPIIFAVEYALAQLLMEWGLYPQALIGYSLGEYVAACLAGVFSLQDALMVVAKRAQMIDDLPSGSMLAVPLGEEDIRPLLTDELSLAIVNGPLHCVVAGATSAVAELEKRLAAEGITGQRVPTDHAIHSRMMQPLVEPFSEFMAGVTLNPPQLPYLSNVTGDWISQEQATSPAYWAEHMCQTVHFGKELEVLLQEDNQVLLEVGPGHSLGVFVKLHPKHNPGSGQVVLPTMPYAYEAPSDEAFLLHTVGRLWLTGLAIDWVGFYAHERRQRLPLPTHPFERQRYWVEPGEPTPSDRPHQRPWDSRLDIADWFYLPAWKQTPPVQFLTRVDQANKDACWVVFLDDSQAGSQIVERLQQEYEVITVSKGTGFIKISPDAYVLHPGQAEDYETLFEALRASGKVPKVIVHLWGIAHKQNEETRASPGLLDLTFYSMLYLAQALGKYRPSDAIQVKVVSNGIYRVTGEETICPEQATLLGPCQVIPQEYTNTSCQVIDLVLPEPKASLENTILSQVIAEITTTCSDTPVAYRGGRRWVQTFEPIRLDRQAGPLPLLRDGGVYLIVGGLGGVGLVLAEYLAKATPAARLVLLGRSGLPSRETWASWLKEHGEQDVVSNKIKAVQRLTELGAKVMTISADVSSEPQMHTAIQQVQKRFGQIHGIVHCAGIELGGMIALKTAPMAASVLAPKVEGLRTLEAVCEHTKLDFLILCSSINSFRGSVGQVDHCASFAFMDAFAHYYTTSSATLTISINWSAWRQVGLAVNINIPSLETLRQDILKYGMSPQEAAEAFERVLGSGLGQVIVSPQDFKAVLGETGTSLPRDVSKLLEEDVAPADGKHSRPVLGTTYVAPRDDVEQKIADIWQRLLGIEGLGIYDNFIELGGHSLLAVQVTSRLNDAFKVEIPLSTFFETPTIASLAMHIRATQGTQAYPHPTTDDREVGAI